MANGIPRSELRKGWPVETHLTQLDDDVDKLYSSLKEGLEAVAEQLEKNRRTWQWGVGVFIGFATIVVAIIALIVSAS